MDLEDLEAQQRAIWERYGSVFVASPTDMKVGISENVRHGLVPLNGLRHSPVGDTTGWYIWCGEELSHADDFFVPLCVAHLQAWCADALPFLGLAPGWRFLKAGDYIDVWLDRELES
ncbi:MAG: hypothetical protein WAN86_06490 [Hyphomicrobiaceae bacterium]